VASATRIAPDLPRSIARPSPPRQSINRIDFSRGGE
jgi:hypothetical protein